MASKFPAALIVVAIMMSIPSLLAAALGDDPSSDILLTPGRADLGVLSTEARVDFWLDRVETDADYLNRTRAGVAMLELARQSGAVADIEAAIAMADDALVANPRSRDARILRAAALNSNHLFEDALAEIEPVVVEHPNSFQARAVIGDANLELQNSEEAKRHYDKLFAMQPGSPAVLSRLAEFAWDTDDPDAALDFGRRALVNANDAALPAGELSFYAIRLARFRLDTGDVDGALHLATQALEIAPDVPAVHSTMGFIQLELGRTDAARASFETAISFTPLNEALIALEELDIARQL